VFNGFSRVSTDNKKSRKESRRDLRLDTSQLFGKNDWLPAIQVRGEGIFFELDGNNLTSWENQEEVKNRIQLYDANELSQNMESVSARYILLHTLSHLIMKELTFYCGYGQASLQERIYVSNSDELSMAGFLIYTASGDSEGTLGGLVRMGKPGYQSRSQSGVRMTRFAQNVVKRRIHQEACCPCQAVLPAH
jgi:hypothetical protein